MIKMSTKLLIRNHTTTVFDEYIFAKYGPLNAFYIEGDSWMVEYQDYRDADDAYYGLTLKHAMDIVKIDNE